MPQKDRWADLTLNLKQAMFERLHGRGVGILHTTLVVVDGELVCWSDPRIQSFGPYGSTREMANKLMELDRIEPM